MIDFNDFEIEETSCKNGIIPYKSDETYYKIYEGCKAVIRDDSQYSGQNPEINGKKIPGIIHVRDTITSYFFRVVWDTYSNSYRHNDLYVIG